MINNIEGGNVDLSNYYTKPEVDQKLSDVEVDVDLSDYYNAAQIDMFLDDKTDSYNISFWESFEISAEDKAVLEEAARRVRNPMNSRNSNFIIFTDRYYPFIGFEYGVSSSGNMLYCYTPVNKVVKFNFNDNCELIDTHYPMPEEKGFATTDYVDDKVAELGEIGSLSVFEGAGLPEATAAIVEGSTGWTAVEITNKDLLITKFTKGPGKYYIGTDSGSFSGKFKYDSTNGITIASNIHLGSFTNDYGINVTGSYSTGYNWIEFIYDAGAAGKEGLVPAPAAGVQDTKWLNSDGTWKDKFPLTSAGLNSEIFNYESNLAKGDYSHAEGYNTEANGDYSHAEGFQGIASATASHIEGYAASKGSSTASGQGSHVEGYHKVTVMGTANHVEGYNVAGSFMYASGDGAHLEGYRNITGYVVSAKAAHVEGFNTKNTNSNAEAAHAEGAYTIANSAYQHAAGKYNIEDAANTYAHIVGNGTAEDARSNAYTLDWSGNATFAGTITSASGADYAEYFEWLDGNPDGEDRVGYIVKLNGDKIELANVNDDILGVISGTMTVLGDNAEWHWKGKYLTDDFGRIIYEYKEHYGTITNHETGEEETILIGVFPEPKINPAYDESKPYVNRKERPEWDAVGMMGKLYVRDDGTAQVNDYVVPFNGVATATSSRTNMRVMERISDNIIRVCLK